MQVNNFSKSLRICFYKILLQNTATKYLFRACGLELNNNQNSGDEKPRRAGEQNAAYTSEAV